MVAHEHTQREAMQSYCFEIIAAEYVHSYEFAVEVFGRNSRKGYWQYRLRCDTLL
jgi:hypothetical protein